MPTNEHIVVKPEKIVATAAGLLEQELILPNLFHKEGVDQFRGAKDDTINVTVPGVLPFREYEWRSGSATSSTPGTRAGIVFDEYEERKVPVRFGGNVYSAVKLTDEQADFDIKGWAKLLTPQAKAVSRGLQRGAVTTMVNAPFSVVIGGVEAALKSALIEARRVLNAFQVPDENRYLVVGSSFESALLNDPLMNLAQNAGDAIAESALVNATIGKRMGFTIVVDQTIPADEAYAFVSSGFVMITAAPYVPSSVPFGATTSFEGINLRWLRDYDSEHQQDRSVVNCYKGFRTVEDVLVGWDSDLNSEVVSVGEHFVRGIKLKLGGVSDYPDAGDELANITGISSNAIWTPTTAAVEPATALAVTPASPALAVGGDVQMVARATYSNGPHDVSDFVTWSSATPAKATITAGGKVTGVSAGTSVITATYAGKTASQTVTVS